MLHNLSHKKLAESDKILLHQHIFRPQTSTSNSPTFCYAHKIMSLSYVDKIATSSPRTHTELVVWFEEVEKSHLKRQAETSALLHPLDNHIRVLERAGCIAAITLPIFGRKLNRVVGLGLHPSPISDNDIAIIQEAYHTSLGINPEFDMVELAGSSKTFVALEQHGYSKKASVAVYSLFLGEVDVENMRVEGQSLKEFSISDYEKPAEHADFVGASLCGFRDNGRPAELLTELAEIAIRRDDTYLTVATAPNGEIVGTAALAIVRIDGGPSIGLMYLDSTVPEHRGKGIQSALLKHRIALAKDLGCAYVTLSVRPGTGSARNAERSGFTWLYDRWTWISEQAVRTRQL